MTCNTCGEKPKNAANNFTKAVVEINNPESLVLLRKVVIPASMGTKEDFPPAVGKYYNTLLQYEGSGDIYLYSSDGIPTKLSSDVSELQHQLEQLGIRVDNETLNRIEADTAIQNSVTALDTSLSTVARSGSYNDLSNKPNIGNATLTVKRNGTSVGTFTANATTNKNINIAVPTKTSDLTNDGEDGTSPFVEAEDMPTVDTVYNASSSNAIANSTVTNSLNRDVMTNLSLDSSPSTTTVSLKNVKTNLASPSSSTTASLPLPVASSTQAGVMNTATFNAVTSNANNINALLNGAVAVNGLPASPTQAELTSAWENETGLSALINRAGVYDVTNQKVWTYYTNDQTWYPSSNTSQVAVNTFTNASEGIIKGSTNDGQVFAENDGTGSINGWDALTGEVANNTSKLATIAQGAEVNVQSDWNQTNTSADDYIRNKPTIPTVNNATLTIQENGTTVETFTANSSSNKTANITVPTAVSELTNDADYITSTTLDTELATKQDLLTAGNAIDITNNVVSADVYPADYFTNESETTNANGSDITLSSTIESRLKDVQLQGDNYQQSYSGKNIFPLSAITSSTTSGVTFTNNGDSITIQGTASANIDKLEYVNLDTVPASLIENGAVYTISTNKPLPSGVTLAVLGYTAATSWTSDIIVLSGNGTRLSATKTASIPATTAKIRYNLKINSGTTVDISDLTIQLEQSSTATTYEPYVGGAASPSPDYPQAIQTATGEQTVNMVGKNLFPLYVVSSGTRDGVTFTNNGDSISINGQATASIDRGQHIPLSDIPSSLIKNGRRYTLSLSQALPAGVNVRASFYSSTAVVGYVTYLNGDGDKTSSTGNVVTIPENATRIRWFINIQNGTNVNISNLKIQLTEGTTPDYDFEPYQSQSYPISLGSLELCKVGSYQDYIYKSGDDWYVHKAVRHLSLAIDNMNNSENFPGWKNVQELSQDFPAATNTNMNDFTDSWDNITGINIMGSGRKIWGPNNSTNVLFANRTFFGTAWTQTYWKTNYAGLNLELYYGITNPIVDTKITDATLVGQLDTLRNAYSYRDVTNIIVAADGNNIPVIFDADVYIKTLNGTLGAITEKQDKLTAGDGISINNNEISVDNTIQRKLVAGQNISIHDNVISATGSGGGDNPLTISIISGSGGGFEWVSDDWSVQFIEDIAHSYWGGRTILIEPDPIVASESYSILQPYAVELNYTTPSTLCLRVAYNREGDSLADLVFELDNNYAATTTVRGRTSIKMTTTDPGEGVPLPQDTLLGVYE